MTEFEPMKTFFFILKVVLVILFVAILSAFWTSLFTEVKTGDLDRFSVEIFESIASSDLTSSRYIFLPDKLDEYDQSALPERDRRELAFARACTFSYYAVIDDLSGKSWEFGYVPDSNLRSNVVEQKRREFDISIIEKKPSRPENFYETTRPAKLYLTVYDTWFTRITCEVEKAYVTKNVGKLEACKTGWGGVHCAALKRSGSDACYFFVAGALEISNSDCRYMPPEIEFENFYEGTISIREKGIDPSKAVLKFYPVKQVADCTELKNNPDAYMPGVGDNVQTVKVCAEAV
ncbi:MAG: hypothetical protein HY518_04155 [Candidatus Aenigmarchaeota archaeon]|nr:hypothetical protein [Candidatus Aenigmarchaeota archaeon]